MDWLTMHWRQGPFTAVPAPPPWPPPAGRSGDRAAPPCLALAGPSRLASAGPSKLAEASFGIAAVFNLKGSQTGVEQLAPRNNDDVKAGRNLVTTENLTNQAFRSISFNRAPQALGGGDPQPADRQRVAQNEQGGKAAMNPGATLVNLLKFGATADVFVWPETSHGLSDRPRQPAALADQPLRTRVQGVKIARPLTHC